MKKKTIKRNILSVLVVMIMLMATLLTACSSGQATETPAKEETTKAEVTEETAEVEQAEEVATPEPTIEPTPEPTPVPTPDTESTLPGVEWIQTFNGIIEVPKLIVFNDTTNKKIILDDFEEVEFYDDDTLAIYIPENNGKISDDYLIEFEEVNYYDSVITLKEMPNGIRRDGYSAAMGIAIEFNGEPMKLYCSLKLMG